MRTKRVSLASVVVLIGLSLTGGGCVDAVWTGVATGIEDGLSAVVQGVIEGILGSVALGGE